MERGEQLKKELLELGWVDKGDILVRYSNPRVGWKPADGTLIVGFNQCPFRVWNKEQLERIVKL